MTYRMTAKILAALIAITGLSGCSREITSSDPLIYITFDRSHGSLWGNQFYIALAETEIVEAWFFQQGEMEQTEVSHSPLSAEEWKEVEQAVLSLVPSLKEKKEKKGIFQKMDGTEERTLTLTWETEHGEKTVIYDFPNTDKAIALEEYLEALAQKTQS